MLNSRYVWQGNLNRPVCRLAVYAIAGAAALFGSIGCGPPKDSRIDSERADAKGEPSLIGTWLVASDGSGQGSLEITGRHTFSVIQTNPKEPGLKVTLEGTYDLAGRALTRMVASAKVAGGSRTRNAEVRQNVASIVEKPLHASIEWLDQDKFKLRDETGEVTVYVRKKNLGRN